MAIRYAGNIEIRMKYERGLYRVSFTLPGGGRPKSGTLTPRECHLSQKEERTSPEAYDKVARRVIGFLQAKGIKTGEMRRLFQAPCPIPNREP